MFSNCPAMNAPRSPATSSLARRMAPCMPSSSGVRSTCAPRACMMVTFSWEKFSIMQALGAHVERTPDEEGMQGAIRRAKELVASDPTAFMAGQFENPANPDYHYETTAQEIFEQMEG